MIAKRIFNVLLLTTAIYLCNPVQGQTNGSGHEWGDWSGWGPCSRECGGGITTQFRFCLSGNCSSASTQYKSCNLQPCVPEQQDFRSVQCSRYNNYTGDVFVSDTAAEGYTDCQLYCISPTSGIQIRTMAQDGTTCLTSSAQNGICIGGICAEMGCDSVLGSTEKEDECLRCQNGLHQAGKECKQYSGYLEATTIGQVLVGVVPMEATSVNITFKDALVLLTNHQHLSLLENEEDREINLGGTAFKFSGNGSLFSRGPVKQQFIVQVRAEGAKTPSVAYYYHMLVDSSSNASSGLSASDTGDFSWQYSAFSQCTMSCGAGSQYSRPYCVDQQHPDRVMPDSFCQHSHKPLPIVQNCFRGDCPPRWVPEAWSPCSASCDSGWRHRSVRCQQIREDGFDDPNLPHGACAHLPKPEDAGRCNEGPCETKWTAGTWSVCVPECGSGFQMREVNCTDGKGMHWDPAFCIDSPRPPSTRPCNDGPCFYSWHTTPWSQCSEQCGNGTQSRRVYCATQADREVEAELCPPEGGPVAERTCKEVRGCQGSWSVSAWSKCTGKCGQPESHLQHREVFCKAQVGQQVETVPDETCDGSIKPHATQSCELTGCPAWLVGEWGPCSVTCDEGLRRRNVSCQISLTGTPSDQCDPLLEPSPTEICNPGACPASANCIDILSSSQCRETLKVISPCTSYLEEYCCATCSML